MKRIAIAATLTVVAIAAAGAGYWWGASKSAPAGAALGPASAKSERKILYYRNPMGLPDTSPVPKKAPDGMDYVPVYAEADGAVSAAKPAGKILYYRNPMGLPDTSPVPKKDPMGMDYVPVYEGGEPAQKLPAGTVKISLDKVQLLGVRTEPVVPRELRRTVNAVGTIQANERLLYKVAPRFEGWIEKLYVNTTGQAVARGQPLMEVYSPDLVTAQEEYLIALRGAKELKDSGPEAQAVMQRLAEGVLRRLRNWEISDKELLALQQDGKPLRLLPYRSAANGVVLQKPSVQGMRFMPGEVLFEIADLSSVWMLADVSEQDVGLVHLGQEAKLRIVAYPDKAFSGKVVFLYPTIDTETRTAKVRIELANPGALLKPAMFANVELASGHARGKVLAVPESAVLDSGARQVVLVRRGEGLFEPRTVKLGMRADGYIEVMEGLQSGDQVVVRANFLIDAESNLKAALETFGGHSGHGGKPPAEKPAAAGAPQANEAKSPVEAVDAGHKGH
jgi:Cu(I)/Ag(I) efflux system membrane fusion protein